MSQVFLSLLHSPAEVVRQLLADGGIGIKVTDPTKYPDWSVYDANEPDVPDNCITVYDVEGQQDAKLMPDSELMCHYGLKFRVRSTNKRVGWTKCNALRSFLSPLSQRQVAVTSDQGTGTYNVWSFDRIGQVLPIGTDSSRTKRWLFTLNCISPIVQIA